MEHETILRPEVPQMRAPVASPEPKARAEAVPEVPQPVLEPEEDQEDPVADYVYLVLNYQHTLMKVGHTCNPVRRLVHMRIDAARRFGPQELYYYRLIYGGRKVEREILESTNALRCGGSREWMLPDETVIRQFDSRPRVDIDGICEHDLVNCTVCSWPTGCGFNNPPGLGLPQQCGGPFCWIVNPKELASKAAAKARSEAAKRRKGAK